MRRPPSTDWRGAGGAGDELVSPDGRPMPGTAPATGFSLSSGLERVA
jgi:hypothetical protein